MYFCAKTPLLIPALLGLLAIGGCASSTVSADVGWRQIELRDYRQALIAFDVALEQGETAELLAGRAKALYFLRQHIPSQDAYARAIAMDPNVAQWHIGLAVAQISAGDFEIAIDSCSNALKIEAELPNAYYNRGYAYQLIGADEAAVDDFTAAIQLNPKFAEAYNNRGIVKARQGALDGGLQDFRTAIRFAPHLASAYANAASVNYSKGYGELAFADLNAAIKIERNNPLYYKNRGKIYLDHGNSAKALEDFERALVYAPGNRDLLQLISRIRKLNYIPTTG